MPTLSSLERALPPGPPPHPSLRAAVAAQCAALDIKSVQHDSMTGHWLLPLLVGGGPAADCSSADAGADAAAGKSLHR